MLPNWRIGCVNMLDPCQIICRRDELDEGGKAVRFALQRPDSQGRAQKINGFAIAFDSQVYAYQNNCPHRGTELDWQPGEVFDETGLYLICATHGAAFEPKTGLCIGGPCRGARLLQIPVAFDNGQVILQDGVLLSANNDGIDE